MSCLTGHGCKFGRGDRRFAPALARFEIFRRQKPRSEDPCGFAEVTYAVGLHRGMQFDDIKPR